MDLKKEYKTLLATIKSKLKTEGSPSRNEDIAKVLGYNRAYFSTLLGDSGVITEDHIKNLKLHFRDLLENVTRGTLANEKEQDHNTPSGVTLIDGQADVNDYIKKRRDQKNGDSQDDGIIYVPINAQAGYSQRIKDPQFEKSFEKVYIPGLKYKGAKYRIFEVEGDSMSETLKEGMQVIAESVEQESWNSIANYYIYVLVSDDMITIKRIFRKSAEEWVLISDNEEFYDQVVFNVSNLKELWKVKRKLDWDLAPPKKFEIKV